MAVVVNLETDRLRLRSYSLDDVDFVLDTYSRPEVQRYLGRTPQLMADREQAIERIERWSALRDPVRGFWLVQDKATDKRLGTLLLIDLPASGSPGGPSGEIEIGWHLHPNAWGRGVATEAGRAVLVHAFARGLDHVLAVVKPGNLPSQRVAERIGMRSLGLTTDYYDTECVLFRVDSD